MASEKEKLEYYLRHLGKKAQPENHEALVQAAWDLAGENKEVSILLFSGLDVQEINYFFAAFLLACKSPPYVKVSTYDVVEAHWEHHPVFNNIAGLKTPCLLMWGGIHDPEEHKEYARMVLNVLDIRASEGKKTCVAFKVGRVKELERALREYPRAAVVDFAGIHAKEKETVTKSGRPVF